MGVRKCIIKECPSSSARKEDRGVTFHRIPIKEDVKGLWIEACRLPENFKINKGSNVCSRHFRKADFSDFKGKKYVLKLGAVPTIFSWSIVSTPKREVKEEEVPEKKDEVKEEKSDEAVKEEPKRDEVETKEEELCGAPEAKEEPEEPKDDEKESDVKEVKEEEKVEIKHEVADDDVVLKEDALVSPLSASAKKKAPSKKKATPKRASSSRATGSSSAKKARRSDPTPASKEGKKAPPSPRKSMPAAASSSQSQINFAPGTKIEAQDFAGKWHPAKLLEVDTEEREVLVQFDKNGAKSNSKLNDEWIPMDSVRLRPLQQPKTPSNGKVKFSIGEKCFARWSDSRKFPATIQAVLENDMYEVLFDDGFVKVCKINHISKVKRHEVAGEVEDALGTPIKQEEDAEPLPAPVTPVAALHIPQVAKVSDYPEIPKSGEWCCHWMNDFPIGDEAVVEVGGVKVHSVIVADWRLPEGWVKHVYQRITTFGKMDVLLVNAEGQIFRSRQELKAFLATKGETYDPNVFDFGLHKKRSKELGFCHYTQEYKDSLLPPPVLPEPVLLNTEINIGSVKVKIIDNLLQCPEVDCLKTFRKENHLQIHIKHYHKELAKGLGEIPNMQDLAALRTPVEIIDTPPKMSRRKSVSMSASKTSLKEELQRDELVIKSEPGLEDFVKAEGNSEESSETVLKKEKLDSIDKPAEFSTPADIKPDMANVSLPADGTPSGSFDAEEAIESLATTATTKTTTTKGSTKIKMFSSKKKKYTKKSKAAGGSVTKTASAAAKKKKKRKLNVSRAAAMDYMEADDTRHSFATAGNDSFFRHGYSFDKDLDNSQMTNASICGQFGEDSINAAVNSPRFINENGEVIKIVSMKKEEIINCMCGYGEEDGLMVQCELCLCWQHGICNGFERDNQVPDKYVCYICRNPQGGRESRKYIHDQDWLYEGKLPVASYHAQNSKHATRFDILKQSHTLGGNLLELKRFMHSLKVKINIAEKKDHPKMYLWSKKWENSPPRGGNGDLSGIVPLNGKCIRK
ncbi:hypothetical protein RP20_CCG022187 [Aedes albopictus]|nr:hypothetical protein RP20_CCG022187 [Aedes albopictus]